VISRLQLWAAIVLAFVAGLVGIYIAGSKAGVEKERNKVDKQRLDNVLIAKEVKDDVEVLDDIGLADRASKWLRNNED